MTSSELALKFKCEFKCCYLGKIRFIMTLQLNILLPNVLSTSLACAKDEFLCPILQYKEAMNEFESNYRLENRGSSQHREMFSS